MHELGVVFHVIKNVEGVAKENHIAQIQSVTLQLGEVSTVIPDYLTDCWNWAVKKSDILQGAELIIEPIKAITYCEDCQQEYETIPNGKTCPHCGSGNTYLKQGSEFIIKEVEAVTPEDETSADVTAADRKPKESEPDAAGEENESGVEN